VSNVTLTPQGVARVDVALEPGTTVPAGTKAYITRRSPIGDLTLELTPGTGAPLADGATIGMGDTNPPPDPQQVITDLARVLHSVPSQDLATVVGTLAQALQGRGQDLASLAETNADLPQKILAVRSELQQLITTSPAVLGVFADNRQALADDISQTALLADILRDRRYDLVKLFGNGTTFATVANSILAKEKPNLSCLIADLGRFNATLAEPQHLADLKSTLDLNHYFFDAVWQSVQRSTSDGNNWFRVHMLPLTQPPAQQYQPPRAAPNVYPGQACRSIYGSGVGHVTQPGPVWLAYGSRIVG